MGKEAPGGSAPGSPGAVATMTSIPRFGLRDAEGFRAFLAATPRSVVLFRGVGCLYSTAFEKAFEEEPVPEGWVRVVREVEEAGRGPAGDAHRLDVTPTVAAFTREAEAARLPGRLLLGITRQQYRRWVRGLA